MGGPGLHSTAGQKRVSTASMAQPRRTSLPLPLPSPPLSLSFFPLFYSPVLPRATERAQSPRPQRRQQTGSQVQQRRTGGPRNDNTVGLLAYLDGYTTHPHPHRHTHTLLLPSSYPYFNPPTTTTSPHPPTSPPTSHMPDFIRHPEKKTGNMLLAWKMLSPHSSALKTTHRSEKTRDD